MDRHWLLVLSLAVAFGGCTDYQELPVSLYLDQGFLELEMRAVEDAIGEWNYLAGERYAHGDAVFEIAGQHEDTFNVADYEDDFHCVYALTEPVPDEQWLQELYEDENGVGAYSPMSDTFVIIYQVRQDIARLEAAWRERSADGELTFFEEHALLDKHYGIVRNHTLHELGHMLGIIHFNHVEGTMNSDGLNTYDGVDHLADDDLAAFCLVYDCHSSSR